MSTHEQVKTFLDAHEQEHHEDGTLCTNLCLAAAFAADDGREPCAEFGSHPVGKHAEMVRQTRPTTPEASAR